MISKLFETLLLEENKEDNRRKIIDFRPYQRFRNKYSTANQVYNIRNALKECLKKIW